MPGFKDIVGQKGIKAHFGSVLKTGNIPHAYILAGERRSGRHFISGVFAQTLVCTDMRTDPVTGMPEPCCKCSACIRVMEGTHPDVRTILPARTIVTGVDDIREQLVADVLKKPFEAAHKLYIIPDADRMGAAAQNAMLKTLEEPPAYATVMLLAENPEQFLPTIRSRSMLLSIKPAGEEELVSFLKKEAHIVDYRARAAAAFASGNTGIALEYASGDSFEEFRTAVVRLIDSLPRTDTASVMSKVRELVASEDGKTDKQKVTELLDVCYFFFRDVLVYRTEKNDRHLIMKDLSVYIGRAVEIFGYRDIAEIMRQIYTARARIGANVSTELVLQLMFISMRREKV